MDEKYLEIKVKSLKSDLDAILLWNKNEDTERTEEYMDDCIKVLKELKRKLN